MGRNMTKIKFTVWIEVQGGDITISDTVEISADSRDELDDIIRNSFGEKLLQYKVIGEGNE